MTETVGMVLDRIEAQQAMSLQLRPDATSLDLLRAVYRNPSIPLPVRIRCAVAALPHEHPRLAVMAQISEQSFAEVLERRIKKLTEMENGKAIEHKPQPVDVRPPLPITNDRRFRRM